ncbi:hypothetical protein PUN4_1150074 [Paraburkholderia unamae]|nr:hypothetical protein PUN4_1150074 [Paraburkholderia unamae]
MRRASTRIEVVHGCCARTAKARRAWRGGRGKTWPYVLESVFTHPAFLRNMALSLAIPCGKFAAPSGWVWHFACLCVV